MDVVAREPRVALAGVEDALRGGPVPAALLAAPLAVVGDALRLGLELPRAIRKWMEKLSVPELREVLSALAAEIVAWSLPEVGAGDVADDAGLAFVVRRRDQVESVACAVRRVVLPRSTSLAERVELAALEAVLRGIDGRLGALLSRPAVVRLLGARAALGPAWADGFAERGGDSGEPEGTTTASAAAWAEAVRSGAPCDEAVTAYAQSGALARYVEGFAAEDADFAVELAASIDGLIEAREDVGLVARRWRKRCTTLPAARDPLRLAEIPALSLAASTTVESPVARRAIRLGPLAPVDAEARLLLTPREVSVQVFEGRDGAVQSVQLGASVAHRPAAGAPWVVTIAVPEDAVSLRVAGEGDIEFVETLSFGPEDSSR